MIFELVFATFHWCRSPTILLMVEPVIRARLFKEKKITYVQIHEALHNFHTWDCSFEHSPGCTRTVVK